MQNQGRAASLGEFPDLVAELGGDPDRLLAMVGLSRDDLVDPEAPVPSSAIAALLSAAARATDCPHFGALLASRREMRTYLGALGRLVWAAPDLESAIREFAAHIGAHVEGSHWALDVDAELARLRNHFDTDRVSSQGVGHNLVLATRLLRAITANRWGPELVYFRFRRPADIRFFQRVFGCPVLFDAEFDGIVFHTSDLAIRLPTADEQLRAILHRHRELVRGPPSRDVVGEVTKLVDKNLLTGVCSIDTVVRFLPYSRSTLQKKLSERGTSYQRILDGVRDQHAQHYLRSSDLSIAELADQLGYANADVFSKAFKVRFGVPPSVWRRANRSPYERPPTPP